MPPKKSDMVRAVVTRSNVARDGRPGGAWTTESSGQEILRNEQVSGSKPIRTIVRWRRPADGEVIKCEVDVMGVADVTGRVPDALIHSLLWICPKCGPTTPPEVCATFTVRGYDCKPRFDEEGQLWLGEKIRCPFMCGWQVRVEAGWAHDVAGRNLFGFIPWGR